MAMDVATLGGIVAAVAVVSGVICLSVIVATVVEVFIGSGQKGGNQTEKPTNRPRLVNPSRNL